MDGYVAADMIRTPWGNTDELRARRLPPGPGGTREAVARNQRERLFAAMVASTATRGYPATTVADLVRIAGVSRATFYEHFEDKADCFRATIEAVLAGGLRRIRHQLELEGPPEKRTEEALGEFVRLASEQPAASRMSLVEAYSAGTAGLEPINKAFETICELTHEALRQLPGREQTPAELARAVIGGLHRVVYRHLYTNEEDALPQSVPELLQWATGYPPPDGLLPRRKVRVRARPLTPSASRDLHEQIIRGFAAAVASRGFPRTTIAHIAAEASISQATFYQHFKDKEDALLAALDLSGAQLAAAALPTARRARSWPGAIRRALESICMFLATEPDFARLRAVEAYAAGPEAIAHRDRGWQQILEEIVPPEVREGTGSLSLEASSGGVYALIYERVRRDELERLPELPPLLTYLMLVPFLGAEEAGRVARGDEREPAAQA